MQTRESVMKKIILMCLFGLILSDTIIYSENGKEYKIENIKIKDQNEKYIKYSNLFYIVNVIYLYFISLDRGLEL